MKWKLEIIFVEILVLMKKFGEGKDEVMCSKKHCPLPCLYFSLYLYQINSTTGLVRLSRAIVTTFLDHIFFDYKTKTKKNRMDNAFIHFIFNNR